MNRTALLVTSAAMLAFGSYPAMAQQKGKMAAIDSGQAVQKFQDICVAHYLDKTALLAKLQADPNVWVLYQYRRPSDITGGMYLESKQGEISYVSLPNKPPELNDPACHFTFVAKKNASHQALVTLVTERLGLSAGQDTSSQKNGPQMRWDYQRVDGTLVRIFVSSGVKANGRVVSRLSISRHRTPPPTPTGQTL